MQKPIIELLSCMLVSCPSSMCMLHQTIEVSMQGVSHRHLSDHLSDLIETTLAQLEEAKVIAIDEDTDELEPLNMAMISSYYYVAYTTMELFDKNITEKTKLRALFEIICGASEFDDLPVRPGEEESIERLIRHAKLGVSKPDYLSSTTKANALLQVSTPLETWRIWSDVGVMCLKSTARYLPRHTSIVANENWPILSASNRGAGLTADQSDINKCLPCACCSSLSQTSIWHRPPQLHSACHCHQSIYRHGILRDPFAFCLLASAFLLLLCPPSQTNPKGS